MFSALEERIKSLKGKDEDYILIFQTFDETINHAGYYYSSNEKSSQIGNI